MKSKRKTILTILIVIFALANIFYFKDTDASTSLSVSSSADSSTVDTSKVNNLQDEMSKTQDKIAKTQQQLNQSQSALYVNQVQVYNTKSVIQQVEADIADKEQQITNLSQQEDLNKALLEGYVEELYYQAQEDPLIQLAVTSIDLNGLTSNTDNMISIKEKILETLDDIGSNKSQLASDQADLSKQKQQHEQLLAQQTAQQGQIVSDIQDTQATLQELQQKMAKLQSDLSSLLGTNVSVSDVKTAAGIASKATGVRKSFILAELMQESGMGRYTGGCTYKNAHMHSYDIPVFKKIMTSLHYGLNDKKVSCPGSGGGYGGAMGIAQFVPTTWGGSDGKSGYIPYISSATGHNPPDPWSVIDGVMGMAKKLADAGATSKKGEYAASMIYYCGTSHPTNTYPGRVNDCNNYAADVQSLAASYEKND